MSNALETTTEISYFQKRCTEAGLTPELNKLVVKKHAALPDSPLLEFPILEEDKNGDVLIPLYDINAQPVNYLQQGTGKTMSHKEKPFYIRRFTDKTYQAMCEMAEKANRKKPGKYNTPKGAKTLPWISPNIIEAYREKKEVPTIVITEGYLKAICGWVNGLHIFGLSGIQNAGDKDTGALHTDIIEAIKTLKVRNIVLLYDGDCNQVSLKAITEGKDLYARPYGFFASARNIVEKLKDFQEKLGFDVYFAHVNSINLDGNPKGLDDLFNACPDDKVRIVKEITSFSKSQNQFFIKHNITYNLNKVYQTLHIAGAEQFYTAHGEHIKDKEFIFKGTKYVFDAEKNELRIIIPGAAKFYVRVGDNFFKEIMVPNKIGTLERRLVRRSSSTIKQDHGASFLNHITKLEEFCNKPSHLEYQKIIDNCYNRYHPFDWELDSTLGKECPTIMAFLKHIFGDQLEIGLDYVQLLLMKPEEPLPILCLVSKENQTGKSTFAKLLKAIFTSNMVTIGNDDLENGFNGPWADKLIIHCEELFVDKVKTLEKIKGLSTGDKIMINQKGIDQIEIDFFGKFIFMSNNEDNFIRINEYDDRYWIRRVPKAESNNPLLLDEMVTEIQMFLNLLIERPLSTKKESRMWFRHDLLITDALRKVVSANKPKAETEIRAYVRMFMLEYGFSELKFTKKYIVDNVLKRRFEDVYVERILKENLKLKTTGVSARFKVFEIIREFDSINGARTEIACLSELGKPFIFKAEQFLYPEEIATFELSEIAEQHGQEKPKLL